MRRLALVIVTAASLVIALAAQRGPTADTEWRYYGGDASSTRYSRLDQINLSNLNDRQVAWRWSSPDNGIAKANKEVQPGAYQDTPLMINGVLYTETSLGTFAAIDPVSGKTLWQYDPEIWKNGRPPNLGFTH